MGTFRVNRPYAPELDVRERDDLLERIESQPPNGVLWPLVAARRAGKTWTLRAIEHRFNGLQPSSAQFVDLNRLGSLPSKVEPGQCLLLDEPEVLLVRDARGFLDRCAELHAANVNVVVAMTPAEWEQLARAAEKGARVSARDLLFLPPLKPAEAKKLARTRQARALLRSLPESWQRSPFLLELVFETAELNPELAKDIRELLRTVIDRCDDAEFFYFPAVFENGLAASQQEAALAVARGTAPPSPERTMLERCGLVTIEDGRQSLADPVLEAHLSPLRIHHISDIHVGPKAAELIWVKERGEHGARLGEGAGVGPVRESYIDYLRELAGHGRAPHIVVVSGDITETGEPEQYEAAKEWLARVAAHLSDHTQLGPLAPRVLIVGGNHDVDWRQSLGTHDARARHRPFAAAFEGFPRPKLEEAPAARPLAAVSYPDVGVEFLLLGSAEFGGEEEKDADRAALLNLVDKLRAKAADEEDIAAGAALRDRVARIDPGLVHHEDLRRAKETQWRQPVRIAVLHHPVSPLPSTEISRYSDLLNAGEVKDTLLHKGFSLVLHGHVHTGWFSREQWPGRHQDRALHVAAAPSLGSREVQEHHGFNEVEVVRERRGREARYAVIVRRFSREGRGWVEKAVMGPFTPQ
ncbi:MAG TPA: metallophosphoesterase [Polyangiaceae bacterium]|jgi:3',5'-cyclic AMP phosphodiesterase CpdA|nr:metallophosphoesterase [Polyangiaceae bacterium]